MKRVIDKNYCMSAYLSFRYIANENMNFFANLSHKVFKPKEDSLLTSCKTIYDMEKVIKKTISDFYIPNKTALLLSGGIDSAILASYVPKGTKAYTFKCIADGTIDETHQAIKYAKKYDLDHEIIDMHWDDFVKLTPKICKYNQVPFHSIEVQLYKAALHASHQGIERFIIGESADLIFGGMDQLLSKDWSVTEFSNRYTFVNPQSVLKEPVDMSEVYEKYRLKNDRINLLKFMDEIFSIESSSSYMHALEMGNIKYLDPYSFMKMAQPLNIERVRGGEPKYMVRELFSKRYPELSIPDKITMPRATEQWFKNWSGPTRDEFLPRCTDKLTGDQKWLVYCLEVFLNIFDKRI